MGGGVGTFDSVDSKILVSGPLDENRVFAVRSGLSDAVVAVKTLDVPPPSTHASGFVMCPAGMRVVGGGIGTTYPAIDRSDLPDADWQLMHSGPLDETGSTAGTSNGDIGRFWYAALRKSEGGPAAVYKVFALCSRNSIATVAAASMSVPAHSARGTAVGCPAGKMVTGGGIGTPATPVNDHLQVSGPLDVTGLTVNTIDGDAGVYWYGNVFNDSDAARQYKVFALCASPPHFL